MSEIKIDLKLVPNVIEELEVDHKTFDTHTRNEVLADVDRLVIRRCSWYAWEPEHEEGHISYELAAVLKNGLCISLFEIDPKNIMEPPAKSGNYTEIRSPNPQKPTEPSNVNDDNAFNF